MDRLGLALERALLAPRDAPFLACVAVLFFVLAAALSQILFGAIPHVQDSGAQFIHARIFASGALTAPVPEFSEFFRTPLMIERGGRWYSQFPPGHTALLALGHRLGAAWLVNPALGALTVIAVHQLARETHGRAVARVAALLTLLCPFVVFMSSEFMNHASALLFVTFFMVCSIRSLRKGSAAWGLTAGAALGMAFLARPYSALAVALPFAAIGLAAAWRAPRRTGRALAAAAAGFLVFAGIQAAFNELTNGDPFLYGYQVRFGPDHRPGFVEHPPTFHPGRHTLAAGLGNLRQNLVALNRHLFGWPLTSFFFVAVALLARPRRAWEAAYVACTASLGIAYVFYFYQDLCFGPRFLYEASGCLIVLTASGVVKTAGAVRSSARFAARPGAGCAVAAALVTALTLGSAIGYLPTRVAQFRNRYWIVENDFLSRLEAKGLQNAVVFVTSEYRNVSFLNPQPLDAPVLYVRSLGERNNARLMAAWPERDFYLERAGSVQLLRSGGGMAERILRR